MWVQPKKASQWAGLMGFKWHKVHGLTMGDISWGPGTQASAVV